MLKFGKIQCVRASGETPRLATPTSTPHPSEFHRSSQRAAFTAAPAKSSLRPYFEAHLLFQDAYHSPSTSPEPEEAAVRPPPSRTTKRKHEEDDENEGYNSGVPYKRRKRMTMGADAAPPPPTTDDSSLIAATATGNDPRMRYEPIPKTVYPTATPNRIRQRLAIWNLRPKIERRPLSRIGKSRVQRPDSMKIGKYSLRRTATQARRAKG
ncbi:hypothetical protein CC80DRAFT_542547 [Byssothecium circinans]|uniref:Uncharacterized protein n=1 Tax=Byssothecium circinans TaxID=147558 RepID=A0A6A5UBU6_9PLEO|nr:hypothetical protein CC80DRAFT_542547 [Byssothecium circinans]